MHKHFKKRQEISAELNGILQDNFSGIKEIQIFNRRQYETERVDAKAKAHAKQTMKGIYWISLMHPIVTFLTGLGNLIVVLFGGLFALNGNLAAADITVFLLFLGLFYTPVTTLARVLEDIQTAKVSGRRVFEIMDTKSDIEDTLDAVDAGDTQGNVEFKNVSFCYDSKNEGGKNDIAVISNISFKAQAGEMVALVGPTGAGKTTVTSLLARFYDPQSGSVEIDGVDIKNMTLESLRRQISVVLQDSFLFNGTVYENIAYGRNDNVNLEEVVTAAKTAAAHEFIESLPNKYETKVGERGAHLSGGQKQRIALARAVLRNSPILILDEATSAVDNETEREIQTAIGALAGKRTMIVIAHRLSTVEKADKILVLKDGEIVESGTHSELLIKSGLYSSMYKRV
jgi:ATP-binding cassette subfamily B protein/subfamily B ATP-binding cassette protein MsbA